jgi:hypothetical protein
MHFVAKAKLATAGLFLVGRREADSPILNRQAVENGDDKRIIRFRRGYYLSDAGKWHRLSHGAKAKLDGRVIERFDGRQFVVRPGGCRCQSGRRLFGLRLFDHAAVVHVATTFMISTLAVAMISAPCVGLAPVIATA